jgi:DNA invertase Pin-like site-specific DNA recombinase
MQYIAYYRVSTDKQGASGLGLEAQQEAVRHFLGVDPHATYVEVESGGCSTPLRPVGRYWVAHASRRPYRPA